MVRDVISIFDMNQLYDLRKPLTLVLHSLSFSLNVRLPFSLSKKKKINVLKTKCSIIPHSLLSINKLSGEFPILPKVILQSDYDTRVLKETLLNCSQL